MPPELVGEESTHMVKSAFLSGNAQLGSLSSEAPVIETAVKGGAGDLLALGPWACPHRKDFKLRVNLRCPQSIQQANKNGVVRPQPAVREDPRCLEAVWRSKGCKRAEDRRCRRSKARVH